MLPLSLEGINFDRFNIYARFVKHLEIYPNTPAFNTNGYLFQGWPRFSDYVKHRVLLPNLLELTLTIRSESSPNSHEQFLWIRMFLSPSLNAIRVQTVADVFNLPLINPLVANALLEHVASNCPSLHTLGLFPVKPQTELRYGDASDYAAAELWLPSGSYYGRLPMLQLRKIECPVDILAPDTVHVLNQLSTVEHLEVYCISTRNGFANIAHSHTTLGTPSTLHHFGVYSASQSTMSQILRLNIFSGLTSLKISLTEDSRDQVGNDGGDEGRITQLVSLISDRSPVLSTLELAFSPDNNFTLTSVSTIGPLSNLPLRSVCLKNMAPPPISVFEELYTIFPLARRIEIPDLEFYLDELPHFSNFPHLECLVVGLSMEALPLASLPAPTVAPNFRILESTNPINVWVDLPPLARCAQIELPHPSAPRLITN